MDGERSIIGAMTTINNQDDFLEALRNNPQWRDAVRAQILGEDLLQLPVKFDAFAEDQRAQNEKFDAFTEEQRAQNEKFDAFMEEQRAQNEKFDAFMEEQKAQNEKFDAFMEEQRAQNEKFDAFMEEQGSQNEKFDAFVEEHRTTHINIDARLDRIDTRLDRMEGDFGTIKGDFARNRTVQDARNIAYDMGLEFVRTLGSDDLREMAGNTLPRNVGRSFRNADLVVEVTDGTGTRYIAMEVSFTADIRDCDRAVRNARLIESFTGKPAQAAVASVRNDREAAEAVESGAVYWHQLEDRTPIPE